MLDTSPTLITFGGALRRTDLPRLAEAIAADGAGPDRNLRFDDTAKIVEFIEAAAKAGEAITLYNTEAVGGRFGSIEAVATRLNLTFVCADSGNSSWTPTVLFQDPAAGIRREWVGTSNGVDPHLSAVELEKLGPSALKAEIALMKRTLAFDVPLSIIDEVKTETRRAEALIAEFGIWGEHPAHSVSDWKCEIANDDTRCGYWEWVEMRLEIIA